MEFTKIALLAGFIIAFIFILVISNKNNPSSPDQFDEYQMTKRNTAFKISFCFLAIWVAISSAVFADGDIEGFPITYSMFSLIGLFITICIFPCTVFGPDVILPKILKSDLIVHSLA